MECRLTVGLSLPTSKRGPRVPHLPEGCREARLLEPRQRCTQVTPASQHLRRLHHRRTEAPRLGAGPREHPAPSRKERRSLPPSWELIPRSSE